MNRIIASLIILCGVSSSVSAQIPDYRKGFEFSGSASLGMSGLNYNPSVGTHANGPGVGLGLGFGYFLTPHWGISTGLDFSLYSAYAKIPSDYTFSKYTYDSDGIPYDLKFKLTDNVKESNTVYSFEIPLLIHYRYFLSNHNALFAAGGLKLAIPFAGHYHVSKGSVTTSGYYQNLGVELKDIPWLGFTSNDFSDSHGMIPLKNSYMASLELGYLYNLSKRTYLTVSLYGNVGINNLRRGKTQGSLLYSYSQYISVPCSDLITRANLISFGIKGAWHVNISGTPLHGQRRTIEQPAAKPEQPVRNEAPATTGRHGMHHGGTR
jgi:hypothetical protein